MEHTRELFNAVMRNDLCRAKELIVSGQDGEGKTPLHWATCGDNRNVVDRLLMEGARTGVRDNDGKTAMDYAREKNIPELIALLHRYSLQG
ncbi:MAG: ankyrin repeat domain-containing protein [Candidatus Xenobiia bacterium LiM19]